MTQENTPAPASSCGCGPENAQKQTGKSFLSKIFGPVAGIGGAGALGFVAGHAGCIITPVIATTLGVTTGLTAGMSALAFAFGAAATAGGVYTWHRLRGAKAGKVEKAIVLGSAITGLAVSGAMQLAHLGHCGPATPCHSTGASAAQDMMGYCGQPPAPRQQPAP
jgi:hypothetical protein